MCSYESIWGIWHTSRRSVLVAASMWSKTHDIPRHCHTPQASKWKQHSLIPIWKQNCAFYFALRLRYPPHANAFGPAQNANQHQQITICASAKRQTAEGLALRRYGWRTFLLIVGIFFPVFTPTMAFIRLECKRLNVIGAGLLRRQMLERPSYGRRDGRRCRQMESFGTVAILVGIPGQW